jgi:hypothetical protein
MLGMPEANGDGKEPVRGAHLHELADFDGPPRGDASDRGKACTAPLLPSYHERSSVAYLVFQCELPGIL